MIYYTEDEIAKYLQVNISTIKLKRSKGMFPAPCSHLRERRPGAFTPVWTKEVVEKFKAGYRKKVDLEEFKKWALEFDRQEIADKLGVKRNWVVSYAGYHKVEIMKVKQALTNK